ncbi:MAG TPA: DUF5647 family protein [Candidatus Nanoarchaeia archaeon]
MSNKEIIEKNLEQHSLFMQYALEHPEMLEKIPDGAEIVFLPDGDPDLAKVNLDSGKAKEAKGGKVIYIKVKVTPKTRVVLVPQVELTTP